MLIRFKLNDHSAIAEQQLELARRNAEAEYRKCGWLDARCEVHGGGVTVTLTPWTDCSGALRFSRTESFCCGLFKEQLENERYNTSRYQWPRAVVRASEPEPRLSTFRVVPHIEPGDQWSPRGVMGFHVLADGEPIVNFNVYATDLNEWDVTRNHGGGYFVITCGCGVPECTGIEQPLQVVHRQECIEWQMLQPREAVWRFAKDDYIGSLDRLLADVQRIVGNGTLDGLAFVPRTNRSFFEQYCTA